MFLPFAAGFVAKPSFAEAYGKISAIPSKRIAMVSARNAAEDYRELVHAKERLQLLVQAMWELLRERLGLTDGDMTLALQVLVRRETNLEDIDMSMLWMGGMGMLANDIVDSASQVAADSLSGSVGAGRNSELREMQHQVERLSLLNQAMWELICDRMNITDADLEAKAREVDMRDGVADGKMTAHAVTCPSCNRVCNSRHHKCIYCGQLFEKPIFG